MKKLSKAIAQRIRSLREAAGLSQQELAVRGDLSMSLVAKLEQGKKADPRASTVLGLASALGVTPGELLDDLMPPAATKVASVPNGEPAAAEVPVKKKSKAKSKAKAKPK